MSKPTKLYLAGGIADYLDRNRSSFRNKQHILEKCGYIILSPLDNGVPLGAPSQDAMRADFLLIMQSDGIAVMLGGELSAGVQAELVVARALHLPVLPDWAWMQKAGDYSA